MISIRSADCLAPSASLLPLRQTATLIKEHGRRLREVKGRHLLAIEASCLPSFTPLAAVIPWDSQVKPPLTLTLSP